ncbi:MAG: hypothetical protein ABSH49_32590 [Bryobacteraceae bacterium]
MTDIALDPQQQQVIDAICSGGAIHCAIAAANALHKDFLAWRRSGSACNAGSPHRGGLP